MIECGLHAWAHIAQQRNKMQAAVQSIDVSADGSFSAVRQLVKFKECSQTILLQAWFLDYTAATRCKTCIAWMRKLAPTGTA